MPWRSWAADSAPRSSRRGRTAGQSRRSSVDRVPAPAWQLTADERRLALLLVWLVEQDRGSSIIEVESFYENDEARAGQARDDVRDLEARGWAGSVFGGGGSLGSLSAMVEPAGRSAAGAIRQNWQNQPARRAASRSALVAWLYEVDAVEVPSSAVDWYGIIDTEHGHFYGDAFTAAELERAAAWLQRNDLVQGPSAAELDAPLLAYLTDRGVTCAEQYGCDVNAFKEAQDTPQRGGHTFNVNAHNDQMATGDQSQQTITIGQTAQDIAIALRGLGEMARELGLADDAADLDQLTEEAVADITSPNPTGRPAQRLLARVQALASRASSQAVATAVTLAVTAASDDVAALVGALGG
jgi:hypothetical protein